MSVSSVPLTIIDGSYTFNDNVTVGDIVSILSGGTLTTSK